MFSDKQRKEIQTRVMLDRIEAESEIAHRENPDTYTVQFAEGARASLEKAFSMTNEQLKEWFWQEWLKLQAKLEAFTLTKPQTLCCDHRPWRIVDGKLQNCHVFATLGENILPLFYLYTEQGWSDTHPENSDVRAVEPHPNYMIISATDLTPESIEQGVRGWLRTWHPSLSEIPISVLSAKEAGKMAKEAKRRELLKMSEKNPILSWWKPRKK